MLTSIAQAEAYWESFLAASRDECTALGLELRSARLDLAKGKLLVQASGGGIDQLQTLSQRMSSYLDAEGDTPDESVAALPPFLLEVTSPGLSDDLEEDRDFETWKGFDVSVGTTEVYKKKTVFEGTSKCVVADVVRGGNACVFACTRRTAHRHHHHHHHSLSVLR